MPQKEEVRHLSRKDEKYLNIARKLASTSECNQRHGAIIVKGGSILSMGVNRFRNDPLSVAPEHLDRCSEHAEEMAIRKAGNVSGGTIYVARINNLGFDLLSRPCDERCYPKILSAGINKIVFT